MQTAQVLERIRSVVYVPFKLLEAPRPSGVSTMLRVGCQTGVAVPSTCGQLKSVAVWVGSDR